MTALGVVLLMIGAILVMVEAHVPSMGAVGGPGAVVMAIGAVLAVSALGGGLLLGVVENFGASVMSNYTDGIAFAVMILVLLFKPGGLFNAYIYRKRV